MTDIQRAVLLMWYKAYKAVCLFVSTAGAARVATRTVRLSDCEIPSLDIRYGSWVPTGLHPPRARSQEPGSSIQ